MKIHWNLIKRKWQMDESGLPTTLLDRALVRVQRLSFEEGYRPECAQTGRLGFVEGELIELPTIDDVVWRIMEITPIRFDGYRFLNDKHEPIVDVSLLLLLPNGQAIKLA
jgi:hypothetical protein